jgi:hypothetical protein
LQPKPLFFSHSGQKRLFARWQFLTTPDKNNIKKSSHHAERQIVNGIQPVVFGSLFSELLIADLVLQCEAVKNIQRGATEYELLKNDVFTIPLVLGSTERP